MKKDINRTIENAYVIVILGMMVAPAAQRTYKRAQVELKYRIAKKDRKTMQKLDSEFVEKMHVAIEAARAGYDMSEELAYEAKFRDIIQDNL